MRTMHYALIFAGVAFTACGLWAFRRAYRVRPLPKPKRPATRRRRSSGLMAKLRREEIRQHPQWRLN